MSAFREQHLIEAPVDAVWDLVGDPRRYPEWAGSVVEVTGLEAAVEGAEYRQTMKTPLAARPGWTVGWRRPSRALSTARR